MEPFEPNDLLIGYTSFYAHLRPNGPANWDVVQTIDPYWAYFPTPSDNPSLTNDVRNIDFDLAGNAWINVHDGGFMHSIAKNGEDRYAYLIGPKPPDWWNGDVNGPSDPGGLEFGSYTPACAANGRVFWWNRDYSVFGPADRPQPYQYVEIGPNGELLDGPNYVADKYVGNNSYIDDGSSGAWTNCARTELWQPEGFGIAGFPTWITKFNLETFEYTGRSTFTGSVPGTDGFAYAQDNESYQAVCECADGRILIATISVGSDPSRYGYHIYLHDADGIRIKEYAGLPQALNLIAGRVATLRLDPLDSNYFLYVYSDTTSFSNNPASYTLHRVNIETGDRTEFALPPNNGAVAMFTGANPYRTGRGPWCIGVYSSVCSGVQGLARLNPDASEEWFKTSGF